MNTVCCSMTELPRAVASLMGLGGCLLFSRISVVLGPAVWGVTLGVTVLGNVVLGDTLELLLARQFSTLPSISLSDRELQNILPLPWLP